MSKKLTFDDFKWALKDRRVQQILERVNTPRPGKRLGHRPIGLKMALCYPTGGGPNGGGTGSMLELRINIARRDIWERHRERLRARRKRQAAKRARQ